MSCNCDLELTYNIEEQCVVAFIISNSDFVIADINQHNSLLDINLSLSEHEASFIYGFNLA